MPKTAWTPREELVCGKLDRLEHILSIPGQTCEVPEVWDLLKEIRYDCERMEAKLVVRKADAAAPVVPLSVSDPERGDAAHKLPDQRSVPDATSGLSAREAARTIEAMFCDAAGQCGRMWPTYSEVEAIIARVPQGEVERLQRVLKQIDELVTESRSFYPRVEIAGICRRALAEERNG